MADVGERHHNIGAVAGANLQLIAHVGIPAPHGIGASRLHTLIPRGTARWKKLYRLRGAVERENGRLKHEWALLPLRVRRLERVQLHADLTILARLACALATARADTT
ncbi:MAG TPA: transposase [Actinomycetes bacterium]|nr:transposase [Actinomycetes bacterium]